MPKQSEQTSTRYYITPDGSWGEAEGLILFTDDDVDEWGVEDLNDLYEELGDCGLYEYIQRRRDGSLD